MVRVAVTFRYRATLISHVPNPVKSLFPRLTHYTPLATFEAQAGAGLTSESFDIEANNIREGDARAGLDERGTQEVLDIMRRERVKCVISHANFRHAIAEPHAALTRRGSSDRIVSLLRTALVRMVRPSP